MLDVIGCDAKVLALAFRGPAIGSPAYLSGHTTYPFPFRFLRLRTIFHSSLFRLFPSFFFFCFWHKSGNKLSDTKSSPSRSQNKGINTRRTTEMAARHALDQLTTQKSKTKTSIGIRIAYGFGIGCGCGGGIEHSNRIRIRSKTKQIERLPRMQNAEWTE